MFFLLRIKPLENHLTSQTISVFKKKKGGENLNPYILV